MINFKIVQAEKEEEKVDIPASLHLSKSGNIILRLDDVNVVEISAQSGKLCRSYIGPHGRTYLAAKGISIDCREGHHHIVVQGREA